MVGKIIIGIVLIGLLAGGYFYWQSTQSKPADTTAEESTDSTSEEATSTPEPKELDKSEFTIEVQNGSGIEGEAGRAKELLEGEDFKVDSTANADNYDYEETVIQAGDDVSEEFLDELKSVLGKKYTVDKSIDDKGDSDADVVVIVGQFDDSGESMVPEEEATPTPEEEEDTTPTPTGATNTPSPSPSPTTKP